MSTLDVKEQPVFGREFVEREIDSSCADAPSEADEWRLLGALEELKRAGEDPTETREVVSLVLTALDALKNNPSRISEAVEAIKDLPPAIQIEWYRTLSPIAQEGALRAVAAGRPDTLREYISSGFAVLNFPERSQVKLAAQQGFDKLVGRLGRDLQAPLEEVGSKIAKLGALADLSQESIWARVADFVPLIADLEGAAAFGLLTFPVSTASFEDIKKLPSRLSWPILDARTSPFTEIPPQVMRGRKVMPCDACGLSKISRELYGAYYGTEVVVERGSSGNKVGFQRAGAGVQEIGYYQNYLDRGEKDSVLSTTRHEIDHLETTLLARVRPEEAFAISSIEMITIDKEDPRRLFPYGQFCRADELRSYLLDHVHSGPEGRLDRALHGKLIHEVFEAIVPSEIDPHSWSFSVGDDNYPGQVVARHVSRGSPKSDNYALLVPLPDSRGVDSPENYVLLEKAVGSLREYVTSLGRYHLGDAEPAVRAEKERVVRLIDADEAANISGQYWPHFHNEPSIVQKIVEFNAPEWLEKLTSGSLAQIAEATDSIALAFTSPDGVRELRDEAIEQLVQTPHRMIQVGEAMKVLPGGDWPAQSTARGIAVSGAFTALRNGDIETFFSLAETPLLFRSSRFSNANFSRSGEEGARLERGGSWEGSYFASFRSPSRVACLDEISPSMAATAAREVVKAGEILKERGEGASSERSLAEKGILVRADSKGRITILPANDNELGRFAAACFTGGGGMRVILEENSRSHYDYETHTLSLGIFEKEGPDELAPQIMKALSLASKQMLFRSDSATSFYLVIRRADPETGNNQMVLIDDNDLGNLFDKNNEWTLDLFKQFLESAEQGKQLAVAVEPEVRKGAWKFSANLEFPTGRIILGGTSGEDRLNEDGRLSFDVFSALPEKFRQEQAARSS